MYCSLASFNSFVCSNSFQLLARKFFNYQFFLYSHLFIFSFYPFTPLSISLLSQLQTITLRLNLYIFFFHYRHNDTWCCFLQLSVCLYLFLLYYTSSFSYFFIMLLTTHSNFFFFFLLSVLLSRSTFFNYKL